MTVLDQHLDEPVSLLVAMIRQDTVNSQGSNREAPERGLLEWLEGLAKHRGWATRRLAVPQRGFNLLIEHRAGSQAPWLCFDSHVDTVGVEDMTIDPFGGAVRAGRVYGRGACDTKGSGAAMLCALDRYSRSAEQPNNVALLFSIDEEVAKRGMESFVRHHLRSIDWKPAGAIVGEPTLLRPVVAHKGVVRWTIVTEGIAAHSSDPCQGRSAISMMASVIQTLESRYVANLSATHPLAGAAACSINVVRGGTRINIIPQRCEIEIDRRTVPGEMPGAIMAEVEAILEDLRRADRQLIVTQSAPFIDPPLTPVPGESFSAGVCATLSALGFCGAPAGVGFGTNASTLSDEGVPAVVLGPGDIAQAHSAEEWVSVEQLNQAVVVYESLMRMPLEGTAHA